MRNATDTPTGTQTMIQTFKMPFYGELQLVSRLTADRNVRDIIESQVGLMAGEETTMRTDADGWREIALPIQIDDDKDLWVAAHLYVAPDWNDWTWID